eukprot:TRINITY_DN32432_c0_g2_i1.p1 TRINITY_DN32432_c0_g2~~TRINITY_DN32432_c0_g2_i1.p1  ORF type:complete len:690 (+),score=115.56 TRINITY_DN32432_c0_g2_i1:93-2072(+)
MASVHASPLLSCRQFPVVVSPVAQWKSTPAPTPIVRQLVNIQPRRDVRQDVGRQARWTIAAPTRHHTRPASLSPSPSPTPLPTCPSIVSSVPAPPTPRPLLGTMSTPQLMKFSPSATPPSDTRKTTIQTTPVKVQSLCSSSSAGIPQTATPSSLESSWKLSSSSIEPASTSVVSKMDRTAEVTPAAEALMSPSSPANSFASIEAAASPSRRAHEYPSAVPKDDSCVDDLRWVEERVQRLESLVSLSVPKRPQDVHAAVFADMEMRWHALLAEERQRRAEDDESLQQRLDQLEHGLQSARELQSDQQLSLTERLASLSRAVSEILSRAPPLPSVTQPELEEMSLRCEQQNVIFSQGIDRLHKAVADMSDAVQSEMKVREHLASNCSTAFRNLEKRMDSLVQHTQQMIDDQVNNLSQQQQHEQEQKEQKDKQEALQDQLQKPQEVVTTTELASASKSDVIEAAVQRLYALECKVEQLELSTSQEFDPSKRMAVVSSPSHKDVIELGEAFAAEHRARVSAEAVFQAELVRLAASVGALRSEAHNKITNGGATSHVDQLEATLESLMEDFGAEKARTAATSRELTQAIARAREALSSEVGSRRTEAEDVIRRVNELARIQQQEKISMEQKMSALSIELQQRKESGIRISKNGEASPASWTRGV